MVLIFCRKSVPKMNRRIEVYEKYTLSTNACGYSAEWWAENMPKGTKPPETQYGYRRTMPLIDTIERPIELPGNRKELLLRFFGGDDMVVLGNYDDFCVRLHDIEEQMFIEDEIRSQQIGQIIDDIEDDD